jgi:hypothetical protein
MIVDPLMVTPPAETFASDKESALPLRPCSHSGPIQGRKMLPWRVFLFNIWASFGRSLSSHWGFQEMPDIPDPTAPLFDEALAAYGAGQAAKAAEGFATVLTAAPDHPDVLRPFGLALTRCRRARDGLPFLSRARPRGSAAVHFQARYSVRNWTSITWKITEAAGQVRRCRRTTCGTRSFAMRS